MRQRACFAWFEAEKLVDSSKIPSNTKTNIEIQPGEDEGSIEVVIENRGKHVVSAHLLVSGMWPIDRWFFCTYPIIIFQTPLSILEAILCFAILLTPKYLLRYKESLTTLRKNPHEL